MADSLMSLIAKVNTGFGQFREHLMDMRPKELILYAGIPVFAALGCADRLPTGVDEEAYNKKYEETAPNEQQYSASDVEAANELVQLDREGKISHSPKEFAGELQRRFGYKLDFNNKTVYSASLASADNPYRDENFKRGDVNRNNKIDIFDLIAELYALKDGDRSNADVNLDKKVNIFDLLAELNILGEKDPEYDKNAPSVNAYIDNVVVENGRNYGFSKIAGDSLEISLRLKDPNGVTYNATIVKNGNNVTLKEGYNAKEIFENFKVAAVPGAYSLQVAVSDSARNEYNNNEGNRATVNVSFTVTELTDLVKPSARLFLDGTEMDSLYQRTLFAGDTLHFDLGRSADDANGTGIKGYNNVLERLVNGNWSKVSENAGISFNLAFSETGTYRLRSIVTDNAGNSDETLGSFEVNGLSFAQLPSARYNEDESTTFNLNDFIQKVGTFPVTYRASGFNNVNVAVNSEGVVSVSNKTRDFNGTENGFIEAEYDGKTVKAALEVVVNEMTDFRGDTKDMFSSTIVIPSTVVEVLDANGNVVSADTADGNGAYNAQASPSVNNARLRYSANGYYQHTGSLISAVRDTLMNEILVPEGFNMAAYDAGYRSSGYVFKNATNRWRTPAEGGIQPKIYIDITNVANDPELLDMKNLWTSVINEVVEAVNKAEYKLFPEPVEIEFGTNPPPITNTTDYIIFDYGTFNGTGYPVLIGYEIKNVEGTVTPGYSINPTIKRAIYEHEYLRAMGFSGYVPDSQPSVGNPIAHLPNLSQFDNNSVILLYSRPWGSKTPDINP